MHVKYEIDNAISQRHHLNTRWYIHETTGIPRPTRRERLTGVKEANGNKEHDESNMALLNPTDICIRKYLMTHD